VVEPPANFSNKAAANYEYRFLADDSELIHGIHDAEERVDGLGLLADHGFVDLQLEPVVVEVLLHLLAIDVEDVQVHHS
jgi:hypothetical protein